jgi:hypothetical protein
MQGEKDPSKNGTASAELNPRQSRYALAAPNSLSSVHFLLWSLLLKLHRLPLAPRRLPLPLSDAAAGSTFCSICSVDLITSSNLIGVNLVIESMRSQLHTKATNN